MSPDTTRFRLDEQAAREALALAAAQEDGTTAPHAAGCDPGLPGIGTGWQPPGDEHGSDVTVLVQWAGDSGVLSGPAGMRAEFCFDRACCEDAADGYRFLLYLAEGSPAQVTLAGTWHETDDLAGSGLSGPAAALEILREARDAASSLLDQLDRYRPQAAA
jgi:hypothetical protein